MGLAAARSRCDDRGGERSLAIRAAWRAAHPSPAETAGDCACFSMTPIRIWFPKPPMQSTMCRSIPSLSRNWRLCSIAPIFRNHFCAAVNAAYRVGTPKIAHALAVLPEKGAGSGLGSRRGAQRSWELGRACSAGSHHAHVSARCPSAMRPWHRRRRDWPSRRFSIPPIGAKGLERGSHGGGESDQEAEDQRHRRVVRLVSGKNYAPELRAEALSALADRNDPKLADAVKIGLADTSPKFRKRPSDRSRNCQTRRPSSRISSTPEQSASNRRRWRRWRK